MEFKSLPNIRDLRRMTASNGKYQTFDVSEKTDLAIHHSLTDEGDSQSFARYHVNHNHWPGIAYHFVILKDGTIEWNHELGTMSYHVGDYNRQAIGICLVGDFRHYEPSAAQKRSLEHLHKALKQDLPNYERTRGHNEFPGYAWKACPSFDYRTVLSESKQEADVKRYRLMTGTFPNAEKLVEAKEKIHRLHSWTLYERADHTNYNPPYRIVTGTFIGREETERLAVKIRKQLGWVVYVLDA